MRLAGGFGIRERYKEVPFSNAPKAAFPAHAKRCLKQDVDYVYYENAIWRLASLKNAKSNFQVNLKMLISHFLLTPALRAMAFSIVTLLLPSCKFKLQHAHWKKGCGSIWENVNFFVVSETKPRQR